LLSINESFGRIGTYFFIPGSFFHDTDGTAGTHLVHCGILRCRQYHSAGRSQRTTIFPLAVATRNYRIAGSSRERRMAAETPSISLTASTPIAQAVPRWKACPSDPTPGRRILSRRIMPSCFALCHARARKASTRRPHHRLRDRIHRLFNCSRCRGASSRSLLCQSVGANERPLHRLSHSAPAVRTGETPAD